MVATAEHLFVSLCIWEKCESHRKTNKQTKKLPSPSIAVQFRKSSGWSLYSLCQHCLPVIHPSTGEKKEKKITEERTYDSEFCQLSSLGHLLFDSLSWKAFVLN